MASAPAPAQAQTFLPTRVGLLGGTFDPIHNAHLALGRTALQHLGLQQLRWLPAGTPWQKTRTITPAQHRLAMVRLATADEPRFVVDDTETRRSGPSYSVDTVTALAAAHLGTDWTLIIGQDQFERLHTWHRWQELVARVTLAVAQRPSQRAAPLGPADQRVLPSAPHTERGHTPFTTLPLPPMPVSSTDIRARVALGQDITHLVPSTVARYIETHGLYRSPIGS